MGNMILFSPRELLCKSPFEEIFELDIRFGLISYFSINSNNKINPKEDLEVGMIGSNQFLHFSVLCVYKIIIYKIIYKNNFNFNFVITHIAYESIQF